jgi:sugar lactone lactonase YvrE
MDSCSKTEMLKPVFTILALILFSLAYFVVPAWPASYYTERPQDAQAVYLLPTSFPVHGDGIADDTTALQLAIDRVQQTTHQGIVFIPEGKYRLTHTVYVWSGIRLIGYGTTRPVFILGANTPGYQASDHRYMLQFAGERPAPGAAIHDGGAETFYSGLSNIDLEIKDGNPSAIGIRFHVGPQCELSHCDIHIGTALAGIESVGGQGEDLHLAGGQYGIITGRPATPKPFLLLDSVFEGQSKAAIKTAEARWCLVRTRFKGMPSAVSFDEGEAGSLWMKDSRLEDISGAALVISDEFNARSQVSLENLDCPKVPLLALFRESGTQVTTPLAAYHVTRYVHGLQIPELGAEGVVKSTPFTPDAAPPSPATSDIPGLPAQNTWVSIKTLGARGDGIADDTATFKDAISRYRAIYIPSGRYRITDTLTLRPDTVLIGLDPATTQFVLPDNAPAFAGAGAHKEAGSLPAYQGIGSPKPILETPNGGTDMVTGIGVDTGNNIRAVGIKWMAGSGSLLSDVCFFGGPGTYNPNGTPVARYNSSDTGPADPNRRWDSQYQSLWVTDGGGGIFKDIWSANPMAQAGVVISNTNTPGTIYGLALEAHVRAELRITGSSNWQIDGAGITEDTLEGARALPIDLDGASHITFNGLAMDRAAGIGAPYAHAVKLHACSGIDFRNVSVVSAGKFAFDSALYDQNTGALAPEREIAAIEISGQLPRPDPPFKSPVRASDARAQKLAGGFHDTEGAAVDSAGNLYFVDSQDQSIYCWSGQAGGLSLVRDSPLDPVALGLDKAGDLLVIARPGAVYSFHPGKDTDEEITPLTPVPAATRAGLTPILPLSRYHGSLDFIDSSTGDDPQQYLSPDGSVFIPAAANFPDTGLRADSDPPDLARTYGVGAAQPGKPFYVADEYAGKTWAFSVGPDGSLTHPKLFAERGETGTAVDALGNVYIAAGRIYVYDPTGREIDAIDVPERPTSIVFGGKDRQTLFICARTSVYAVHMKVKGQ